VLNTGEVKFRSDKSIPGLLLNRISSFSIISRANTLKVKKITNKETANNLKQTIDIKEKSLLQQILTNNISHPPN
jgi:hypothetical protein